MPADFLGWYTRDRHRERGRGRRRLADADLIGVARTLAERCIEADPALSDASLADIVTDMEMDAAGDWLERT